jgi:CheY-like chemotaxis protein
MNKAQVAVLVVDDLRETLTEISKRLRGAHPEWQVQTHETAKAALLDPVFLEDKVSVVVCDYLLPGEFNGLDTLIKMMRLHPRLQTILITQDRRLDLGAEALRWGVADFILKGDDWLKNLLEAVENGVSRWRNDGGTWPSCFAAMPFGGWFDGLYRRVWKPAASITGARMVRSDELPADGLLLNEIGSAIDSASVVVADLTLLRANVLFEAGLALGKGKRLILVTSQLKKVPSNLQGFYMIVYNRDGEAFEEKLKEDLIKALGRAIRLGSLE